ncbi:hypothetical protein BHE74_00052126, partial [Ensete ventricosum]
MRRRQQRSAARAQMERDLRQQDATRGRQGSGVAQKGRVLWRRERGFDRGIGASPFRSSGFGDSERGQSRAGAERARRSVFSCEILQGTPSTDHVFFLGALK